MAYVVFTTQIFQVWGVYFPKITTHAFEIESSRVSGFWADTRDTDRFVVEVFRISLSGGVTL